MTEFPENIVTRKVWGKRLIPKTKGLPIELPIENIILEHARYFNCDNTDSCQEFIVTRKEWDTSVGGFRDLKFNFMIGKDGMVYEGRGWTTQSEMNVLHPYLPLEKTLNIGFFGFEGDKPVKPQTTISKAFIKFGIEKNYIVENPTYYADL